MIPVEKEESRIRLMELTYLKAQAAINQFSDNPLKEYSFYPDHPDYFAGDGLLQILSRLTYSVNLEELPNDFGTLISTMEEEIGEYAFTTFFGVFYNRLLHDNAYLFYSNEEYLDWELKYRKLFHGFGSDICYNYKDFYESHFKTQFFNGDNLFFRRFYDQMDFTYVFVFDYEWHTIEDFGASFMRAFEHFARNYYLYYKELVKEIQKRKAVMHGA